MTANDPFAVPGRFYKGNLHTHSTRSDAVRDPADVCALYRDAGYRTICLDTLPDMHAAQALYRNLGFEPTAPYYPTPIAGTIFMRKTLSPPST